MDAVIGFFEWLVDFLKENGWFLVFCVLAILAIVFIFSVLLVPVNTTEEEINVLKNNCEVVAYGPYNETVVDFRLQRCVVPDGVCYVSSGGGVDCKWENADD